MSLVLDFGIELEFLLRPKSTKMIGIMRENGFHEAKSNSPEGKTANRLALRKALVELLSQRVDVRLDYGNYEMWTVVDERSLDEQAGGILYVDDERWPAEVCWRENVPKWSAQLMS